MGEYQGAGVTTGLKTRTRVGFQFACDLSMDKLFNCFSKLQISDL